MSGKRPAKNRGLQQSDAEAPAIEDRSVPLLKEWFDHLQASLHAEAEQVGLLEHSTMMGNAREFLVQRVLRSILPPMIHVGSGKVFDSRGTKSRQIDVVLYDSRFPVFEVDRGIGLYPIEGVIGTVEVKSTLTRQSLSESLANAKSVIDLQPHLDAGRFMARVEAIAGRERVSHSEAVRRASWEIIPATYVFAYTTRMRRQALASAIEQWFRDSGRPAVSNEQCPVLPRLIVAGNSIAIQDDGYFLVDSGADVAKRMKADYGHDVRIPMGCWNTPRPFGFFACHILNAVCNRIGLQHGTAGVEYDIKQHLPVIAYARDDIANQRGHYIAWPRV